jgi:hypothetical protein
MAWSIYLKVADVLQSLQKIWSSFVSYKKNYSHVSSVQRYEKKSEE